MRTYIHTYASTSQGSAFRGRIHILLESEQFARLCFLIFALRSPKPWH